MKKGMNEHKLFPSVATGAVSAIFTYPLFAALLSPIAFLLSSPQKYLGIFSMLALIAAGTVCGFTVARRKPDMRVACAVLSALTICVVILGLCVLVNRAIGGQTALTCVIFSLSAVLAAYLYRSRGKKRRRRT